MGYFLTKVEILRDHTPVKGCLLYMSIDNSELGSSSEGIKKEASDLADPGQGWPPPGSRLPNLLPRPHPRPLSTIQATKTLSKCQHGEGSTCSITLIA